MSTWVKGTDRLPPKDVAVVMRRTGSEQIPMWEWRDPPLDLGSEFAAVLTRQDLIDLRRLISIAVWIRAEQRANPNQLLAVDTHDIHPEKNAAEMRAGIAWFQKLTQLVGTDIATSKPSWEK